MKAKKVFENINFERGQDPKSSMNIGLKSHAVQILSVEEELFDGTPVNDLPKEDRMDGELQDQFYNDPIEKDEAHYLLNNWEEEIHPYYGFWILAHDMDLQKDFSDAEWVHPRDLENSWVKLDNQYYWIPKKLSLNESYF